MTQLAVADQAPIIEQVVIQGDLSKLQPAERVRYYREVCQSLGLNELTRPFEYITLNGKLTLYARKDATDQLRGIRGVSVTRLERERIDDLYVVTAYAADKSGRQDSAIGAVHVKGLQGEALANALMKAETKAKRRVTLSLCGLGWSDETEVPDIPSVQTIVVDTNTGEVVEERKPVPMITSLDDKVYRRYADLVERAAAAEIEYEAIGVPVERQRVIAEGMRLKPLVEAAEQATAPA